MNRCSKCNVEVFESEKKCPLCFQNFEKTADTNVQYPEYNDIVTHKSALRNVPLFVTVTASLICIYINFFTHEEGDAIWSIVVSASLIFSTAVFSVVKSTSKRFGAKIFENLILVSVFIFIIDLSFGMSFWSTNYVFPYLIIGTSLYLMFLAIRSKRLFSEYFGYIISVTILGITPIPIYLFGFSNLPWGMFVSVISSAIIALGLYFFADKTFKEEIKKRFHR